MIDLYAISFAVENYWSYKLHRVRAEKCKNRKGYLLYYDKLWFFHSYTYESDFYWVATNDGFANYQAALKKFPNAILLKRDFFDRYYPFCEDDFL